MNMRLAATWEQKYLCASAQPVAAKKISSTIGWSLIFLFCLQCFLLGANDEVDDPGKLIFAALLGAFVLVTLRRAAFWGMACHESVIKWTLALIFLALCSRLVGISSGIPTMDWLRDSLPLWNFWWIFLGPFAFSNRRNIRRAYVVLVIVVAFLTLVVTDHYLTIRHFSTDGLELISYLRATDSVVLFGIFLTLPMMELPRLIHRIGFGFLGASFIVAALFTGTRSHLGAVVAGLAFYFWLTKQSPSRFSRSARRAILASIVLGLSAFGIALASGLLDTQVVMDRAGEVSSLDFGALTQRMDESVEAWNGFEQSPVWGKGLGYRMPIGLWSIQQSQEDLFMIHNFYLYVLLKFGMVGIPIFWGFFVSMIRTSISTYRQARLPFDSAFSAGAGALLVALLVESLTAARFSDRSATALLALVMVFLLSMRRQIAAAHLVRHSAGQVPCLQPGVGTPVVSEGLA